MNSATATTTATLHHRKTVAHRLKSQDKLSPASFETAKTACRAGSRVTWAPVAPHGEHAQPQSPSHVGNTAHHYYYYNPPSVHDNLHSINYMDMTISKGQRWIAHPHLLDVKLFEKSASKHLYIPYTSNHPKKTLTGFIYGEARRIICLSSSQQDALNASRNFADSERLQARGYPLHVIIKQLQKADYNSRHDYIFSSPKAPSTNTNQLNPTNSTGGNNATNTSNNTNARTVTCVLPYSKFSQDLQLQRVASTALERYNNNTSHVANLKTRTAWYNGQNLQQRLKLHWLKTPTKTGAKTSAS